MTRKRGNSPPINKGGQHDAKSDVAKLIALEWKIINKLWRLAQKSEYDKHRGIYYQNLASHARTLAMLLKLTGGSAEKTEDLAKLLQQISKKAKKFVRDMHGKSITRAKA